MKPEYDMHIDYDVLNNIEDSLEKIIFNLENSSGKMKDAILRSQEFLAGNQFEKAKTTTELCVAITQTTKDNIRMAIEYIDELRGKLEEYGKCGYKG